MTHDEISTRNLQALRHFQEARQRALLEQLLARLTGAPADLLSFEEVRQKLHGQDTSRRSLQEIPVDAIVGSVGRYTDFTRNFLPLREEDKGRWTRVEAQMSGLTGLPPIEVYRIGDAYFVRDGNHRVSVARQHGATHIEAYVTEVETKVSLEPDVRPDDLILKAEYAEFLARTRLDELRPQADLRVTLPGRYQEILEQIEVHRYWLGLRAKRDVPFEEAAADWYDTVYAPLAEFMARRGMLRDFPNRTYLDLYAWIMRHRQRLTESLEWDVSPEAAARDLAAHHSSRPERVASRMTGRLLEAVVPDALETGPPVGAWRDSRPVHRPRERLFADILVPVTGNEEHWFALNQALQVAQREGSRILGLHVVDDEDQVNSPAVQAIRAEFHRRCLKHGGPAQPVASLPLEVQFAVDVGPVARVICDRSWWTDLVVVRLTRPPAPQPLTRLSSGFRTLVRLCGVPLLVVPRSVYGLDNLLLAYNGKPKSREALYLAAYLASRWQKPLTVVTVRETTAGTGRHSRSATSGRSTEQGDPLSEARDYLEAQEVACQYVETEGPVVERIGDLAASTGADLIIMGGYGSSPVVEIARDSKVNEMLRSSRLPLLICR